MSILFSTTNNAGNCLIFYTVIVFSARICGRRLRKARITAASVYINGKPTWKLRGQPEGCTVCCMKQSIGCFIYRPVERIKPMWPLARYSQYSFPLSTLIALFCSMIIYNNIVYITVSYDMFGYYNVVLYDILLL